MALPYVVQNVQFFLALLNNLRNSHITTIWIGKFRDLSSTGKLEQLKVQSQQRRGSQRGKVLVLEVLSLLKALHLEWRSSQPADWCCVTGSSLITNTQVYCLPIKHTLSPHSTLLISFEFSNLVSQTSWVCVGLGICAPFLMGANSSEEIMINLIVVTCFVLSHSFMTWIVQSN